MSQSWGCSMWPSRTGFSHPPMRVDGSSATVHGSRARFFHGLWTHSVSSHPLQSPQPLHPGDSPAPLPPVTSLKPQAQGLGPCATRMALLGDPAVCPGLRPQDHSPPCLTPSWPRFLAASPQVGPKTLPRGLKLAEPPLGVLLMPHPLISLSWALSVRPPGHSSPWDPGPGAHGPLTAALR